MFNPFRLVPPIVMVALLAPATLPAQRDSAGTARSIARAGSGSPDRRLPALAAGIAVFPGMYLAGLGSFYAGDSRHGLRHLLIGVASLGGVAAGWGACGDDCQGLRGAPMGLSLTVFFVNWIWSIGTAVKNAKQYNRDHSPVGSKTPAIQVAPWVSGIGPEMVGRGGPSLQLGLVRLRL